MDGLSIVTINVLPECGICLSGKDNPQERSLVEHNKHYFHVECLERWRSFQNNCPTCRGILPAELPWEYSGYQLDDQRERYRLRPLQPLAGRVQPVNPSNYCLSGFLILICIITFIGTIRFAQFPRVNPIPDNAIPY